LGQSQSRKKGSLAPQLKSLAPQFSFASKATYGPEGTRRFVSEEVAMLALEPCSGLRSRYYKTILNYTILSFLFSEFLSYLWNHNEFHGAHGVPLGYDHAK